jgi:hypothetical protein
LIAFSSIAHNWADVDLIRNCNAVDPVNDGRVLAGLKAAA